VEGERVTHADQIRAIVRHELSLRGISKTRFAEMLGTTKQAVSSTWLKSGKDLKCSSVDRMMSALGLELYSVGRKLEARPV
jgi:predicted transcriptional regulator